MTTVSELKTMYVKLGGNLADVENIQTDAEMIDKIEDIMGSKILPDASEAEDGDVLTVDDGAWAIGEIPKELPTVTSDDNGDVLTVVEGEWAKASVPTELPTVTAEDEGDVLTVNASGEWTNAEPVKELPTVTASDNGSALGVVNGAWAKTNYKLVFKDITMNTDADGKIKSSEFTDYPQGLGLGTTCVILGANILNATSLLTGNVTEVWAETRQALTSVFSNTNFIVKKIESGQEDIIANTSITLRVFYLVSAT